MSQTLDELVVKLTADMTQFNAAMLQTQKKMETFVAGSKQMDKAVKENTEVSDAWATAMKYGPLLAIGALIKIGADYSGMLDDISDRTGLAASKVAVLNRAAIEAGVGAESLVGALERMNRTIGGAIAGNQAAKDALTGLGVSLSELKGLDADDQMQILAKALASIEDPAERAARATEIFGKSSSKLLELLKDFEGATDAARRGMLLTADDIDHLSASAEEGRKSVLGLWDVLKQGALVSIGNISTILTGELGAMIADEAATIEKTSKAFSADELKMAKAIQESRKKVVDVLEEERKKREEIRATIQAQEEAEKKAAKESKDHADKVTSGVDSMLSAMDAEAKAAMSPLAAEDAAYKARLDLLKDFAALGDEQRYASFAYEARAEQQHQDNILHILNDGLEERLAAEKAEIEGRKKLQEDTFALANENFANMREGLKQEEATRKDFVEQNRFDLTNQYDALATERAQELALEETSYNNKKNIVMAWAAEHPTLERAKNQALTDLDANHERNITNINAEEAEKRHQLDVASLNGKMELNRMILGNLATLMQSENRKLFEFGKAAAIGEATVNTYLGASKAMAEVPYPFNFAAAASVVAAGLMNVQKIVSTQFGGGGGAGGGGGGTPASGSAGSVSGGGSKSPASGNNEAYSGQGNGAADRTVNVYVAEGMYSDGAVKSLVGQLKEYARNGGAEIMVK